MIYLHALASSWRLQGFFLEDALPSNTTTVAWAIWEFWHFHLKFRIFMQLWRIPSIHTTKSKYVQWSLSMSPQNACAIIRRRKNELKFLNPKINFAWTIFLQNILSQISPANQNSFWKTKLGPLHGCICRTNTDCLRNYMPAAAAQILDSTRLPTLPIKHEQGVVRAVRN